MPQLSVMLRNFSTEDPGTWDGLVELAAAAERAGVNRLVVVDHVVFGEALDDYAKPEAGGMAGAKQPTGPDGHWLEPLTLLSVIAGRTSRVRLATGVLLAALRRPVVLAKTLSTLDVLSSGRVDLGVGVGWQRAEYEAAGLDFGARGRLLDETLELCQRLWREPFVEMAGAGRIHQMPKPIQPGGVPVWVSGRSSNPRVAERIARYGTGWIPWGDDIADPKPGIAHMRDAMAQAGRGDEQLQVTAPLPTDMGKVGELAAAGVTDFRYHGPIASSADAAEDQLADLVDRFAQACS